MAVIGRRSEPATYGGPVCYAGQTGPELTSLWSLLASRVMMIMPRALLPVVKHDYHTQGSLGVRRNYPLTQEKR